MTKAKANESFFCRATKMDGTKCRASAKVWDEDGKGWCLRHQEWANWGMPVPELSSPDEEELPATNGSEVEVDENAISLESIVQHLGHENIVLRDRIHMLERALQDTEELRVKQVLRLIELEAIHGRRDL